MKATITFLFFSTLFIYSSFAQTEVSGTVKDSKGKPVFGANIFIEGTYDGTTSIEDGSFSFFTNSTGFKTLVVSFVSFQMFRKEGPVSEFSNLIIKLKDDLNSLDAVILNAGSFQAGDKARVSVLKPLDIVTTAGSAGDIVAALQSLPGTQIVGESGRLFVRGGEAGETQTFVDGIRVAQPYGASIQNLPARGRFSPFLFSGISFSTGGYSAEYGEALSSILLLNTNDKAYEEKTEISVMTVGLGLGHTEVWEKSSLSLNTSYINLAPYQVIIPQNLDWNKAPESLSGEVIYKQQVKSGIWKLYAAFDSSNFDVNQQSINYSEKRRINLKNNNFYLNTSLNSSFGNKWQLFSGASYGYSNNSIGIDAGELRISEHALHLKGNIGKRISNGIRILAGAEYFFTDFREDYFNNIATNFNSGFKSNLAAAFIEADILFSKKFAAKAGIRATYNELLEEANISPRISIAYKTGENSQFAAAFGNFYQTPGSDYLKFSEDLSSEGATHYILNYQYNLKRKLFRAEIYHKEYSNLIKFSSEEPAFNSYFNNTGEGYASGLDLFWRDGSSIKNLEYWVSYSYIDSKRDYKNFPAKVTPDFVADHSLSLVTKYWIENLRSQVGFAHNYSSGRPYNNPNETGFMKGKTKDFHNLSFNWAYLLSDQKILYFSVSNILGSKNVFGYEYANNPDANGNFDRRAITPTAHRFFFVGFFWTISADKKSNQLKNL